MLSPMKFIIWSIFFIAISTVCNAQSTYTVKTGDTLESIAQELGFTVDDIKAVNPGVENLFYTGLKLNIPMNGAAEYSTASASGFGGGVLTSTSDKDHYRRSSLCLILLAHNDKQYADAMVRVFEDFPMPNRYNEHNVYARVFRVEGKQSRTDIERLLRNNNIARDVVGRWFNRDLTTGTMDMDLIHERGGYGAFHDDYLRTVNTARGTARLRDEGIELLESTFVLVCDMDYVDRKKGFDIAAGIMHGLALAGSIAGEVMSIQAQSAANDGNYEKANEKAQTAAGLQAISATVDAGAEVVDDLGGFSVNIYSYLYRLNWNEMMTNTFFNRCWVDTSTPRGEAKRRRELFDNMRFGLEYIGDYKAHSGKTVLLHCNDEDEVILDVCSRSVEKCIKELAERFEVFRPRTPFYFEGTSLYSHIGSKEDVVPGKKYEIIQRVKKNDGRTTYKRLGVVQAVQTWDNTDVDFSEYFDPSNKGTLFVIKKGKAKELAEMPGLQIREMK